MRPPWSHASPVQPAGSPRTSRGRRQWPLPKQADPDAPLLVVENLRTYFTLSSGTVKAVDGVSFELHDGEALGIAGESGCGKTTTALSLLRLLPANAKVVEGSVKLFGIDLAQKSENALRRYRWREISVIFQGAMNALNPVQRVGDQVAEPIVERLGLPKAEANRRARELLELVGIARDRAADYPHQLSGGMRQRAMIAMALACDPAIVIGDEPTTALDVMVQAQILELLERLREELGLSLILITHDLSVIAETCDRVMVMYAGRVAEEGPVRTIFRRPAAPVHPDAPRGDPEPRLRQAPARDDPGLAARPADPAARLPLPPALPDGDGGVPRGRPAGGPLSPTASASPATSTRPAATALAGRSRSWS